MARPRFRTDRRLWGVLTAGLFVALGVVDPWAGASKGDNDLWSNVWQAISHRRTDMLLPFLVYATVVATAAAVLSWPIQAVIVVFRSRHRTVNPVGVQN